MGLRSRPGVGTTPPDPPTAADPRLPLPRVALDRATEALLSGLQLQQQAAALDSTHRSRARRDRRLRRAFQVLVLVALLVAAVAVWLFVPVDDWWSSWRAASEGRS